MNRMTRTLLIMTVMVLAMFVSGQFDYYMGGLDLIDMFSFAIFMIVVYYNVRKR